MDVVEMGRIAIAEDHHERFLERSRIGFDRDFAEGWRVC